MLSTADNKAASNNDHDSDSNIQHGPETIVNVARYLKTMARVQPYAKAVIFPQARATDSKVAYTHLTFLQLDRASDILAYGLEASGIRRQTRTIIMVRPSLEFFILTFAMFKVGAVPVMVDPGMGIGRMVNCLKESRAQAMVGIPQAHVLRIAYRRHFKSVKHWITVGRRWFWSGPTLDRLLEQPLRPFSMARTTANEVAAILFTTGSTGPAKGTIYTHGVFDSQIRLIKSQFEITPGEIDLPTFPLFSLFDPALGMTAVIPDMDPTRPASADPVKIIQTIEDHGVTNMFASPALLDRLGRYGSANKVRLASLKRVITAGAPAAPAVIERFVNMLEPEAQVYTGYGATEAMPVSSFGSRQILEETRKLSEKGYGICVGPPVREIDVEIIRISDNPILQWSRNLVLPPAEIGEIAVRGPVVTKGYFERPRDDALSKITDGGKFWHRMGDLGWKDTRGRIWFCGRKNQRVITAEKTLYTIPCEAIFNNHPMVYRSALVGCGKAPDKTPLICIELEKKHLKVNRKNLAMELFKLAGNNELTAGIKHLLFHPGFPVDIRHNAKIFREKLAVWAEKNMRKAYTAN